MVLRRSSAVLIHKSVTSEKSEENLCCGTSDRESGVNPITTGSPPLTEGLHLQSDRTDDSAGPELLKRASESPT